VGGLDVTPLSRSFKFGINSLRRSVKVSCF